ncbi:MAG: hypothetical protein COB46_05925 [Rhodospirillaceae bacterium]|nr:MAG: hypothetical protein COB46_05925 [Rhodospirillaceae bacterium]
MIQHPPLTHLQKERGFTLIEVMVGMVLASILVMGLTSLWSVITTQFQDLNYRQRAVFALNGEMERLSAIYASNTLPTVTAVGSTGRFVYSDTVAFVHPAANIATFVGTYDGKLLYFDGIAGTTDDRNLVWIDYNKQIVGKLTWENANYLNIGSQCVIGGLSNQCNLITMHIEYPFRMTDTTNGTLSATEFPVKSEIDLVTIVGGVQ